VWDVSPHTLHEHSALPSRHKQPGLLTCAICLFYECVPRALLVCSLLHRTLGTITWLLFALISPVIDVAELFHSSCTGTCPYCNGRGLLPHRGSHRKWTSAPAQNHTPNGSGPNSWRLRRLIPAIQLSPGSKRNTSPTSFSSSMNAIGAFGQHTEG